MQITIKNCNNIDNGNISIKESCLNIKYAINGTGKSTISRAILSFVADSENGTKTLEELTPFKFVGLADKSPEVLGAGELKTIKVFDEKYVDDFIFQPDELLKGSFDVFMRTEDYERGMIEIEDLVEAISKLLAEDKDIDVLISDFNELSGSFGKPTKTGIHGLSPMSKSLKGGNKVANIPSGLEVYSDYIQNDNNYKWIKWQLDGQTFIDISENCPYCVNDIKDKKATIRRISDEYESKAIENLNKIIAVFQRLNMYFSDETKRVIEQFINNVDGYTNEQIDYLLEVKDQIDRLNERFISVKLLGFRSLKDVDKVIEALKEHKIDLAYYPHLKSGNTQGKVDIVNKAIDELLGKAGELQGTINKQKLLVERLVQENSNEINGFLKNAGYQYSVNLVEDEKGQHRLKLNHNDIKDEVSKVKMHLSFGERNAFSLLLFMYDALRDKPDLIILDDPISSFDKNKKYAIVDTLFRKAKFFREKTVLLLTHDFEPIVDMVYHHTDKFVTSAAFLENTHGELHEKEICRSDIMTFIEVNEQNIDSSINVISKLVYLRRLCEVAKNRGYDYQLISNIFHKRDMPIIKEDNDRLMTQEEINEGCEKIKSKIQDFDYENLLQLVKNDNEMKTLYDSAGNNYEKLHIYRIIYADKHEATGSNIIQKFINEAFHLENDYIYQLNPCSYQLVPQYVIDECDKFIQQL